MSEQMVSHQPPAVVIKNHPRSRREKLEQEERELEELIAEAKGVDNSEDKQYNDSTVQSEDNTSTKEDKEDSSKDGEDTNEELSKEEKTWQKRHGDLRRHTQKKEKVLEEEIQSLKDKLAQASGAKPPKTVEELKSWITKYPDLASFVSTLVNNEVGKKLSSVETQFEELEEQKYAQQLESLESLVLKKHPEFAELKNDEQFIDWLDTQPEFMQTAMYDNIDDASSIIRVVDLYKMDHNMTKSDTRQNARLAASSVKTRSKPTVGNANANGPTFTESQIHNMSMDEYIEKEADILKAQREGRIVRDM